MVCHGELARSRPITRHLTEFYFWISLGGVLASIFNVLAAPAIFDTVLEYPIAIVIARLLRYSLAPGSRRSVPLDILLPALGAALMVLAYVPSGWNPSQFGETGRLVVFGTIAVALYAFSRRPIRFAAGVAAVLFVPLVARDGNEFLVQERGFFEAYSVETFKNGSVHLLRHGTTLHGIQVMDPRAAQVPISYYSWQGPLGQLFKAKNADRTLQPIGAVGLGIGPLPITFGPVSR